MSKFNKVSKEQYFKDCGYTEKFGDDLLEAFKKEYDDIALPKRATIDSAGYDFVLPFDISLAPNETMVIPTGIKWECDDAEHNILKLDGMGLVLEIYPRSGLGFKYQLGMANTVGIIDMGYSLSDNEGHIMIKLVNHGTETIDLLKGKGFAQGIIKVFYCTDDDKQLESENPTQRNGGMGSTDMMPSEEFLRKLP